MQRCDACANNFEHIVVAVVAIVVVVCMALLMLMFIMRQWLFLDRSGDLPDFR